MSVPAEIASCRRRREIVKNAALGSHPLFSSVPQDLLDRLSSSERLADKIYKKAVEEFETFPPANRLIEAFLTTTLKKTKETAKIIGLAYSLPTFGTAVNRADLELVSYQISEYGMKKVLDYARVVSDIPIRNYESLSECFTHMEADGWVMIELWARHNGVNPRWRIRPEMTEKTGIASMLGSVAIDLVNQAMMDLANDRAEA